MEISRSVPRGCQLLTGLIWVVTVGVTQATESWVIGGGTDGATWNESAVSAPIIDFTSRVGWIMPSFVDTTTNIVFGMLERGGKVASPNAQAVLRVTSETLSTNLGSMLDGNHQTAFEVKNISASGLLMVFDLGARFGVNHIRFFPRTSYPDDFMRGYALSINDGISGADLVAESDDGLPPNNLFVQIDQQASNSQDTINVQFPLQYVRYLLLQATDRFNWEIDEIEIFGQGFVPEAAYTSEVLDLNRPKLLGHLRWSAEPIGHPEKSRVFIRSRSGTSPSPIETPDAWSPWSAPYVNSDTPIRSPAPRQYLQIRLDFESDGLEDGTAVDSLEFHYSDAVAEAIIGEVWPQNVAVGVDTTFTYFIQVKQARGFDRLEIDSSVPVNTVRSFRVDSEEVIDFSVESSTNGVIVGFPRQVGSHDLQVIFDAAILRYETVFTGRLFDSQADGLPQEIEEGNADATFSGDDLTVQVPLKKQEVVHRLHVMPNPFTPNGDGFNDQTVITYDLLHLIADVPVSLKVYNLAGTQLLDMPVNSNRSGRYMVSWNGQGVRGGRLPPGVYVLQIQVETDSGLESRSTTVAIAY